MAKNQQNC